MPVKEKSASAESAVTRQTIRITPERVIPLHAVGPYLMLGLLSFALAPMALFVARDVLHEGFYRHHWVLLAVHLYTLGLGTAVALGAIQQLSVVVFQTYLPSHRLARVGFWVYAAGLVILLGGGFGAMTQWSMPAGGALVGVAVLIVLANPLLAIFRASRPSPATPFILCGLCFLLAVTGLGIALGTNLFQGWLQNWQPTFASHLAAGIIGWLLMMVVGVSYELLPFFGMLKGRDPRVKRPSRFHRWVLSGLLIAVTMIGGAGWVGLPVPGAAWFILSGAILLFLVDHASLFSPREPIRRHPALAFLRTAHVALFFLALAAVWMGARGFAALEGSAGNRALEVVGLILLSGWLGNTVIGYLHRIVPFLVWHNRYWGVPAEQGPTAFHHMVNTKAAKVGWAVYNLGLLVASISLALGWGTLGSSFIVMGLGAAVTAGNLLWTFRR